MIHHERAHNGHCCRSPWKFADACSAFPRQMLGLGVITRTEVIGAGVAQSGCAQLRSIPTTIPSSSDLGDVPGREMN